MLLGVLSESPLKPKLFTTLSLNELEVSQEVKSQEHGSISPDRKSTTAMKSECPGHKKGNHREELNTAKEH